MVAVRTLLATFNGLTHAGVLARSGTWPGSALAGETAAVDDGAEPWYEGAWAHAGDEPPLEELLRDPVVRLVMRADRWEPSQVRRYLRS